MLSFAFFICDIFICCVFMNFLCNLIWFLDECSFPLTLYLVPLPKASESGVTLSHWAMMLAGVLYDHSFFFSPLK